ncbi:MAG: helix-turn-helix domain-containing protein, partial [Bacteroidota bacterium]
KNYRSWSLDQFSNMDLIDFKWFRNFIYSMIFWLLFREIMMVADYFLNLEFYQDWWWNLALVAVSTYVGLAGYTQKQPSSISFESDEVRLLESSIKNKSNEEIERSELANKLEGLMTNQRLFLQSELSLLELSRHLHTNPVQLSATINKLFKKNFNDFVNTYRINEFIRLFEEDHQRRFTLLSLALDAGFASKATFNRAFKKIKGVSPREFLQDLS